MNAHPSPKTCPRPTAGRLLRWTTALALSAGLAGLTHAFGVTPGGSAAPSTTSANPFFGNADAARKGEELFGRTCQQCHNTRGHGGKCPQLVRGAWAPGGANSDTFMFETISKGRPNTQMASFGLAMSQEEIWQIVTFLREEAVRVKAEAARKKGDEDDTWY